ncbi:BIR repeat [Cinara cedri]|uniref:BIR repeat n=1 Tax=Cinara cedri TaxID=506608 RepID=A0A5E4NES1_9HEMI|nr:BIR repeat [Cinara cedri]
MADLQNYIISQTTDPTDSVGFGQIWESNRLKTMEKWPLVTPSAEKMVEAGFYCPNTNEPDLVKCFSCFIELDGWEPTDDPWKEHEKRALLLNPKCKYIEIGKKESELIVDDFLDIVKSVMLRALQKNVDQNIKTALSLHKKKKSALKKELQKMGLS